MAVIYQFNPKCVYIQYGMQYVVGVSEFTYRLFHM